MDRFPSAARIFPFLRWWPMVDRHTMRADLTAGLTGAVLGLPQGVAFAILAGLPPEYGLYAAMIPAALSALFGSSLHMVAGPTNAVAILLFASLSHIAPAGSPEYIRLVLMVTLMTGLFELVMGIARLGALVNFISHTVIIGFSAGAAILIATSQLKVFFGIPIPADASFFETLHQFALQAGHINPWVTAVGAFTVLSGIAAKKYLRQIPFMIAATVAGSLFALALDAYFGSQVTGISTVGALPARLPPLSLPDLSAEVVKTVGPTALATTILALTLAVGVGRSLGIRSGQRIDSNQEFIGQGISNIIGSLFSAYPSAGSIQPKCGEFRSWREDTAGLGILVDLPSGCGTHGCATRRVSAACDCRRNPIPDRVRAGRRASHDVDLCHQPHRSVGHDSNAACRAVPRPADCDLCGCAVVADAVFESGGSSGDPRRQARYSRRELSFRCGYGTP